MPNILDCFTHWYVQPDAEDTLAQADVVAVHEFGDQQTPSRSTAAMVLRGVEYSKKYCKPLICQYPGDKIAEKMSVRPVAVIKEHGLKTGAYLDTEEVNRQIAQVCKQHCWEKIIICAHPHHIWRAGLNLKRHQLTPLYPYTADIPYDQECLRLSMREPWVFVPREVLVRGMYLWKGYI